MLTTLSALAMPTKPEVTTMSSWQIGDEVYLYNVEAGLFLTGGNWWGTRACGADNGVGGGSNNVPYSDVLLGKAKIQGHKFKIGEGENVTVGGNIVPGYCFENLTKGGNIFLFQEGEAGIWIDGDGNAQQMYNQWYLESVSSNTFRIAYNDAGYIGFQLLPDNDINVFLYKDSNSKYLINTTWAFVSPDVYDAIIEPLNIYSVSNRLNEIVSSVKAFGVDKDLSYYEGLLSNEGTTYAQYASAAQELTPFVSLGEAIAEARTLDAEHDWSEFTNVFENREATTEDLSKAVTRINAFISLKKKLNDAIAKYSNLDFSASKAVYDNAASDNETLAQASASVDKIIVDYTTNLATLENPADITSQIPGLDGNSLTDWTRTFTSTGTTGRFEVNTWSIEGNAGNDGTNMTVNFMQIWEAQPAILSNQKFYRNPVEVAPGAYKITANIRLYNEGGGEYMEGVKFFANFHNTSLTKPTAEGETPTQANAIDGAVYGDYNSELLYWKDGFETYAIVPKNGTLSFGLSLEDVNFNWIACKNFRVYYLGDSYESLDYVRKNSNLLADAFDESVVGQKTLVNEYNAAVAAYNSATTAEALNTAYAKIVELQDSVVNNVAAYKAYIERLNYIHDYMGGEAGSSLVGNEVDLLTDYLDGEDGPCDEYPNGSAKYVVTQLDLTTPEIKAELEFLDKLYQSAIENGMSKGTDVTDLLTNASFKEGFTGWKKMSGATTGVPNFGVVEVFDGIVGYQQTVKAKPGVYAISLQAFERPAANGKYDGTEASKVFIFMNKFKTPVMNIVKDALDPTLAVNKENSFSSSTWQTDYALKSTDAEGKLIYPALVEKEGYLVPNSMEGASYAFKGGRYKATCYGLVEDGEDMTIGITSNGIVAQWVLWADFRLTFMGKDPEAVASVIESITEEYAAYVQDNQQGYINGLEAAAASAAIDAAEAVVISSDEETLWNGLIALNAAYSLTKEHVALMKDMKTALDELDAAATEFGSTASSEVLNAAESILTEDYDNYNNDEISDLIARAKDVAAAVKIPGNYAEAKADEPVDFTQTIVNNGFETGNLTGWINEGDIYAQTQDNSEFDNKRGTWYAEKWHVEGSVNINQTVTHLPAGYYAISAYVYSSASDAIMFANEEEISVTTSELYTVVAPVDESGELKFGVKWTDDGSKWTCLDEFTMQYLGTVDPTGIQQVAQKAEEAAKIVAIYTVSGAPVATLQKGLNIVKYADGSVKKIFVK